MRTRNVPILDTITRVLGSILVTLGALSTATILTDRHESIPVVLGILTAVVGAVQLGLRNYVQESAVATEDVVEVLAPRSDDVIAGPANDLVASGAVVRTIGYDPRHHVAD